MMKKLLTLGILFTSLCFGTSAFADYDPSGDTAIQITTADTPVVLSSDAGNATFQAQEGLNNTVTDTTGINSDHSYIWVNVNGEDVLAVDPPEPCF